MDKHKTRNSKDCLNCGAFVEKRFCPVCGQENIESRGSFYHLFTHFASDLVHYDGSFWRTISTLLFSPGKLTEEYMKGKRKSYLEPFNLYIFISLFAFFLYPMLYYSPQSTNEKNVENLSKDSIAVNDPNTEVGGIQLKVYKSVQELDSAEQLLPENERMGFVKYQISKCISPAITKLRTGNDMYKEKLLEFLVHNLPKMLFICMPLFALFQWLLYYRRNRYFFDSGIFTLHLFSFLLLFVAVGMLVYYLFQLVGIDLRELLFLIGFLYLGYYLFKANRRFYKQSVAKTLLKTSILEVASVLLLRLFLAAYIILTMILNAE